MLWLPLMLVNEITQKELHSVLLLGAKSALIIEDFKIDVCDLRFRNLQIL